jgi:hypothetical protein
MANQVRAVVDHAYQHGRYPFPLAGKHLARPMVEIQIPQAVDVIDLEAAHQTIACGQRPGGRLDRSVHDQSETPSTMV